MCILVLYIFFVLFFNISIYWLILHNFVIKEIKYYYYYFYYHVRVIQLQNNIKTEVIREFKNLWTADPDTNFNTSVICIKRKQQQSQSVCLVWLYWNTSVEFSRSWLSIIMDDILQLTLWFSSMHYPQNTL